MKCVGVVLIIFLLGCHERTPTKKVIIDHPMTYNEAKATALFKVKCFSCHRIDYSTYGPALVNYADTLQQFVTSFYREKKVHESVKVSNYELIQIRYYIYQNKIFIEKK